MMRVENEYKTTKLGEIPGDWEFDTLDSITVGHKQGYYTRESYSNIGTKLIRITDLRNQTINYDSMPNLEISAADYEAYKVKSGDFLFARSGAIGRYGIVRSFDEKAIFASYIIRFRFNQKKALNDFIGYFYQSYYSERQLSKITQGSSNININANNIKSLQIPLPPIKEQQKIAEILSTVDEQIEQTDQLIEKIKELKKGLLQQLLTKGIGHTKFKKSELGEIPKEWGIKKLSEITNVNPENISTSTPNEFIIKYIDIESVNTGRLSGFKQIIYKDAPSRAKRIVKKNDIILSTVRPYLKAFAKVNMDDTNLICSTGFAVIRVNESIDSDFIYQFIFTDLFLEQLLRKMRGSNYPAVNSSDVSNALCVVPPLKEQQKIAEILSSVDEDIEGYQEERSAYVLMKKSLMQQLLTGKTRVKVD